ncbi:MAG: asparagine synthase (glutamine-hydrolyzing) [Flavobacteriales bacterium]
MCGINGIFGLEQVSDPEQVIKQMNATLAHRGPDYDGVYSDEVLALGHRRLSIIDTAAHANQPFFSKDKSIVLVFNGEIYNYLELKEQLTDYSFDTSSDTEVIIAAYQKWGIDCLNHFNGMFALAIWDTKAEQLLIARDRLGIKPLYYAEANNSFIFSSELRALLSSNLIKKQLDPDTLTEYLRYQTVHSPKTILKNVYSIPSGHALVITDNERKLHQYWDITKPKALGNLVDPTAVKSRVRQLLKKSVDLRMRADVPFGAFLSGGIDSSAIVGLMSEDKELPVSTFSVVFNEREFSEAPYAELIAKKFKTNHHEILLTATDFLDQLPHALKAMDHPSGDGPNTYLVSKVTKEAGITMALSGLGGDELFAGYSIFNRSVKLMQNKWLTSFAGVFRSAAGKALKLAKPGMASAKISDVLHQEYMDLPHSYSVNRKVLFDDEINRILTQPSLKVNAVLSRCNDLDRLTDKTNFEVISKVSVMEMDTYMKNVLLRDSDQMSMAHALEVRVPFLDHNLVEYALKLSDELKYPHTPKQLLVESLGDLLPPEIVNRPKMGFTLPWDNWMRNELRPFCEAKLDSLKHRDEFNAKGLDDLWNKFLNNDKLTTWSRVWPLVVLGSWLEENGI